MSEFKFKYRYVRISPRKIRLVTNLVKDMTPENAMAQLKFSSKDAAKPVHELIKSAVASFKDKNIDINDLSIKSISCDEGPSLKRRTFRSRGRASLIKKRTSHINLVIELNIKKKDKKSNKAVKKG